MNLLPINKEIKYFSANGVPYPLDDYYKLTGKQTQSEIAKIFKKWFKFGEQNEKN